MVTTSDLQRIAEKQRKTESRRESGLPRSIDVSPQILDSHALVITGVRRCGKSTLMTQRIRKSGDPWFYLKFDAPQLVNLELADSERLDARQGAENPCRRNPLFRKRRLPRRGLDNFARLRPHDRPGLPAPVPQLPAPRRA